MTGIKADLLQWFIQFLIKRRLIKTEEQESVLGQFPKTKNQLNNYLNQLSENLKKKLHSPFIDSNRGAHLADMQLLSKCNKEIDFLLYAIDIFDKNASAVLLKDKKSITIIWVDKGCEFYNKSLNHSYKNT